MTSMDRNTPRPWPQILLTLVITTSPTTPILGQAAENANQGDSEEQSGEDQDLKVFQGAILVEASPIVQSSTVDSSGSLVTTVGRDQIDDLYAQDLTSALRRVPGVVISRYNPVGAFGGGDGGAFFIRGHGSSRPGGEILMLTDGIPRFVGIWTHPLIDVGTMDSLQHVDVYRSAQPVLLGNMAFGAVDMASRRHTSHGNGGRISTSYGTHDTLIGSVEYGGRSDTLDYYLTLGHRRSDGHRENAEGEISSASGRIGFDLGDRWSLSVLYEHVSSSVNDPGKTGAPPIPIVPNYDINNNFALTTVEHSHGRWNGKLKIYVDDGTFDWLQWSDSEEHAFRSVTDSTNYGLRWRESVSPWPGGELVFGLDNDIYGGRFVEGHPDNDRQATDLQFRNTAPYALLAHTFAGNIEVTPSMGVRYNDSRYFGGQWGAQAGLKIDFSRHSLYANYAHGFNLPGVYAAVSYSGWGRGDQWQELEAETIDHMELGWLVSLGTSLQLSASVYRDEVDNAIRFVPPPPPPPLFANIGAYTVRGLELSLQAEPVDRLAFFLGGTLSDADPENVPDLPRTTAVGGVTWAGVNGWRINLDLQWVDERYVLNPRFASSQAMVDAYVLANTKIEVPWSVFGLDLDGSVFAFVENLTDEAYEHRIGYPMPGRMIQIGIDIGL